ncbi:MAG: hypothetical protein H5T64_08250 [Chloroflexi bacterium]|nr:hypothetical protein [Chloroflexota bacterium]
MPSERDLIQQVQSHVRRLVQALADAQYWHDRWLGQAEQEHERRIAEIDSHHEKAMVEARSVYEATLRRVNEENSAIISTAGLWAAPWDDSLWASWSPVAEGIPRLTRIGELVEAGRRDRLAFPALLPIVGGRNVLIKASGAGKEIARAAIQSVLLRLLVTLPPGKLRLVAVDPVGLGSTVAGFIKGLPEFLTGGQAWFEDRHIEQCLADLEAHMAMVKQKYLGVTFSTMEEYNAYAGQIEEPYRLLVVADFPSRFTDSAAQRLLSIATNGPGTGVYVLAMVDADWPKMPYGFNLADLERTATVITCNNKDCIWRDADFKDCHLELDRIPSPADFERFVKVVGAAAVLASEIKIPFETVAPTRARWWQGDSRAGIKVPIGQFGAREVQYFTLDEKLLNSALIIGKTGSGKSTLLHVLTHNLALTYSPEEVQLYLLDLKEVEFKDYATYQLPHARVVAINYEREFGLSVLRGLDDELRRRMDIFRQKGVTTLSEYRNKTGEKLPRILLMVDEFQELFREDDAIASQAGLILDRLVREGRAFGINILLASQTLTGPYTLALSTKNQIQIRIALQCSDTDSRLVLSDDNDHARLLGRPGEAIYNAANGRVEGNNRFQAVCLAPDERRRYLQQIQEMAQQRGYVPPQPQIVFEGKAPADVQKNRPLHDLLMRSPLPRTGERPGVRGKIAAWLGEPVAIKDPTAAYFRRQSGSNLLIVGQNDEAAMGMMVTALISIAAQLPSPSIGRRVGGEGRFYVLDFGLTDAPYAGLFSKVAELLPHPVRVTGRRGLPEVIAEISAEVNRRMHADDTAASPIYLFIYGLQRARDLRQEEFGFPMPGEQPVPPSPAKQFATILQEGPDLGIHSLVWCDSYTNLTRTLDRRSLREFEMRVVFQMSAEDSSNLIDTPAASKLRPYRGLYYSEEEGRLEKFRPYSVPSMDWLAWVGERLRGKRKR